MIILEGQKGSGGAEGVLGDRPLRGSSVQQKKPPSQCDWPDIDCVGQRRGGESLGRRSEGR